MNNIMNEFYSRPVFFQGFFSRIINGSCTYTKIELYGLHMHTEPGSYSSSFGQNFIILGVILSSTLAKQNDKNLNPPLFFFQFCLGCTQMRACYTYRRRRWIVIYLSLRDRLHNASHNSSLSQTESATITSDCGYVDLLRTSQVHG